MVDTWAGVLEFWQRQVRKGGVVATTKSRRRGPGSHMRQEEG